MQRHGCMRLIVLCTLVACHDPAVDIAAHAIGGQPSVSTSASTYPAGTEVVVAFDNFSGAVNDWVGIFPDGSPDTAYLTYRYTGGAVSGTLAFNIRLPAGTYRARGYFRDSFQREAESDAFTVTGTLPPTTVSTAKSTYAAGEPIDVTSSGMLGSSTDWIGIAPDGAPDTGYIAYRYTGGASSGTLTLPGVGVGTYRVRAYFLDSFAREAETGVITVTGAGVALTVNASYALGQPVDVTFANMAGTARDWIGLYRGTTAPDGAFVAYRYTGGQVNGSVTFLPPSGGTYVARAFFNDSFVRQAETAPFTVTGGTPTSVSTNLAVYATGPVVVRFDGMAGVASDWVGIAPDGAPDTAWVQYKYTGGAVSGTLSFTGITPGRYRARAYFMNSYTREAESAAFDVIAAPPLSATPEPIGANIPDLFWAYLGIITPTDAAGMGTILDDARAAGITHVRFAASLPYPINMTTGNGWVANPGAYWAAMDAAVANARARGIRLVPSILWNHFLFPDVAGEPAGAMFTPGTSTRQLTEQYVTELVTRYAGNETILFWELGNELNLLADLDFSSCDACGGDTTMCVYTPGPILGTPCTRSAADEFYSCNSCRGTSSAQQDLGQFAQAMAQLIHAIDPDRPVSSGYAYMRSVAYHLAQSPCPACANLVTDSESDYRTILAYLHPPGVAVMSVHDALIPSADYARFGSTDQTGVDLLVRTQAAATALGKTLYVGEISENNPGSYTCGGETFACNGDPAKGATHALLDALVANRVPFAAVWAWQFHLCNQRCLSVEPGDALAPSIATHNAAYTACLGQPDGTPCPIGTCTAGTCHP